MRMLCVTFTSPVTSALAGDGGPERPPASRIAHGPCDSYFENIVAHLSRKDRRGRRKTLERLDENTTRSAERRTDRRCTAADRHDAATEDSGGGGQAPAAAPLAPGRVVRHFGRRLARLHPF